MPISLRRSRLSTGYLPSVDDEQDPGRDTRFRFARAQVAIACGIILLFSVLGRLNVTGTGGGPIVLSFAVAIAMAYFFGRLDSHYLAVNRWMLAPFYLYVVMQVSWADFAGSGARPELRVRLFGFALLCKVYMFFMLTEWIRGGQIQTYLIMARMEHQRIVDVVAARTGQG